MKREIIITGDDESEELSMAFVIDGERVSMYYADIAEEIVAKVIPDVLAIIDRHMATEKGKRLL